MITDKTKKNSTVQPPPIENETTPELVQKNPFSEMFYAVKRALLTIKVDPDNQEDEPYFKTIKIDNGQYSRIIRDQNTESEIAFPAVFIHFVNVRYLVQQQRIGEGRATMRVRFILNNLNNQDEDMECEAFEIFQKINMAIQDAKSKEEALNERCNLLYFDQPSTTNMLQAYWIDYEVWFREQSAWKYRNWIKRYIVMPPFTNHSDAPGNNTDGHPDHDSPSYKDTSKFMPSIDDAVGTEPQPVT